MFSAFDLFQLMYVKLSTALSIFSYDTHILPFALHEGSTGMVASLAGTTMERRLKLVRFSARSLVILLVLNLGTSICAIETLWEIPCFLKS